MKRLIHVFVLILAASFIMMIYITTKKEDELIGEPSKDKVLDQKVKLMEAFINVHPVYYGI